MQTTTSELRRPWPLNGTSPTGSSLRTLLTRFAAAATFIAAQSTLAAGTIDSISPSNRATERDPVSAAFTITRGAGPTTLETITTSVSGDFVDINVVAECIDFAVGSSIMGTADIGPLPSGTYDVRLFFTCRRGTNYEGPTLQDTAALSVMPVIPAMTPLGSLILSGAMVLAAAWRLLFARRRAH